MKNEPGLTATIRQSLDQEGSLTVEADSLAGQILADLYRAGDVEPVSTNGRKITYRAIPMPHPYRRRDIVLWLRDDGTKRRARVTGISRHNIRILTLDDSIVRNVDPNTLRYAYNDDQSEVASQALFNSLETPLDQAIILWLERKTHRSCSASTRRTYSSIMSSFRTALHIAHLDFDSDPQRVAEIACLWATRRQVLHTDQSEERASFSTFNQRLSLISSFYKFALQQGVLTGINPIDLIERRGKSIHSSVPISSIK